MDKTKNKKIIISILVVTILGIFSFFTPTYAGGEWIAQHIFGPVLSLFISALGFILMLIMKLLVYVSQYNDFINAPAVTNGWVIIRDICNMFFVVILLIIAFATIFRVENYSLKKNLPKLLMMAVLINFSKTICGLLIDVAQIVMLTFVNSFKDIMGGNLMDILGIKSIVTLANNSDNVGFWAIIGAYVLGILYLFIAIVVISAMVAMLVMRIVMIWIYVVISPAAYLLSSFPGGQKYASEWWSQFAKDLITGPVLAFFIWLSFTSMQGYDVAKHYNIKDTSSTNTVEEGGFTAVANGIESEASSSSSAINVTEASDITVLIRFVIAIAMLLAGLKVAQNIGGITGSAVGKVSAQGWKTGRSVLRGMDKIAKQPFSWGADKLHEKTGVDLKLKRAWNTIQQTRATNKANRYSRGQQKARKAMEEGGKVHGILAMTGNSGDAWNEITSIKGIKKRLKGGKRMKKDRETGIGDLEDAEVMSDIKQNQIDYMKVPDVKGSYESGDVAEEIKGRLEDKINNNNGLIKVGQQIIEPLKKKEKEGTLSKKEKEKLTSTKAEIKTLETENTSHQTKLDDVNNYLRRDEIKKKGKKDIQEKISKLEEKKTEIDKDSSISKPMKKQMKAAIDKNIGKLQQEKDFYDKGVYDKADPMKRNAILQNTISQKEKYDTNKDRAKDKIDRNTPAYAYEARANEQKMVNEEMNKISNISDASELVRLLMDAIKSKDTTKSKAILLKLTKDGNDNEALTPLVGRSDYKGLQALMRAFSDKSSDLYAGFDQQEAFALGSQIAELNKSTHHWAATAAYVTENGRTREMTSEEHEKIVNAETGKIQLQQLIRAFNRLAYGWEDKDKKFHLDNNGVTLLMKLDSYDGHANMKTMNESAAKKTLDAILSSKKLRNYFSQSRAGDGKSLIDMLRQRLGEVAEESFIEQRNKAADLLKGNS